MHRKSFVTLITTAALVLAQPLTAMASPSAPGNTMAGVEELAQGAAGAQNSDETAREETTEATSADPSQMDRSEIGKAMKLPAYTFEPADETAYLLYFDSILESPDPDAAEIVTLDRFSEVHVTGTNQMDYWQVEWEGRTGYISSSILTFDEEEILAVQAQEKAAYEAQMKKHEQDILNARGNDAVLGDASAAAAEAVAYTALWEGVRTQTRNPDWDGPVLSRSAGSVTGPSGKETYYNLNMSGVVSIMRSMGNYDEYWVRNDGCKMLGPYIMCAANLRVHPRGSLVECSLGTCIVCDTGGFASHNAHQLDIAVTW